MPACDQSIRRYSRSQVIKRHKGANQIAVLAAGQPSDFEAAQELSLTSGAGWYVVDLPSECHRSVL